MNRRIRQLPKRKASIRHLTFNFTSVVERRVQCQTQPARARRLSSNPASIAARLAAKSFSAPDAEACSWQIWKALWEVLGMSHVELVCGSCGEPLREFFHNERK